MQGADVPALPVEILDAGPAPFSGIGVVVEASRRDWSIKRWGGSVAEIAGDVFEEACRFQGLRAA